MPHVTDRLTAIVSSWWRFALGTFGVLVTAGTLVVVCQKPARLEERPPIRSLDNVLAEFRPVPYPDASATWARRLPYLDTHYAADPKLLDWVLQRLRGDDATILDDLRQMPHVWRMDFLPELLRRFRTPTREQARFVGPSVLRLLDQRGGPHRDDAAVCAELAAPWVLALGTSTPAELEAMPRDDQRLHRYRVNDALRYLGMARDRSQLDRVTPWLMCKVQLWDDRIGRSSSVLPQPERLCETACDAVLRLLGEDPATHYLRHANDARAKGSYREVFRDRQIAALQEQLRAR